MTRKPDLPCAGCGKLLWRTSTSLPDGEARCNPCRGQARKNKATVESHVCRACGLEWQRPPTRGRAPKFCPGCRLLEAAKNHRPRNVRCVACGKPDVREDCYFCSKSCASSHRERKKLALVPATRVFITDCRICSKTFVSVYTNATCSDSCKELKRRCDQSDKDHRRRARERDAYVARVAPHEIHQRDRWRCHICRKRVSRTAVVPHPHAATIDHLIPLASGGTHEPANVATAHFICNSLKGDRGGGEQLMLVG